MRPTSFILMALVALASACASSKPLPAEKLYFAVELRHDGKVVGKPKLLGETGKSLKVLKRAPGSEIADYELTLFPQASADGYHLRLDVATPAANGHGDLDLLHGEERKVELGIHPGDLEVKLLMMKVDSPEFRAFMRPLEGGGEKPNWSI
jgi:hypothetical protein